MGKIINLILLTILFPLIVSAQQKNTQIKFPNDSLIEYSFVSHCYDYGIGVFIDFNKDSTFLLGNCQVCSGDSVCSCFCVKGTWKILQRNYKKRNLIQRITSKGRYNSDSLLIKFTEVKRTHENSDFPCRSYLLQKYEMPINDTFVIYFDGNNKNKVIDGISNNEYYRFIDPRPKLFKKTKLISYGYFGIAVYGEEIKYLEKKYNFKYADNVKQSKTITWKEYFIIYYDYLRIAGSNYQNGKYPNNVCNCFN